MNPRRIERRIPLAETHFSECLHPLLQRIYAARQIHDEAALDNALSALYDYRAFSNMEKAVTLLADCLEQQRRILIVGDFDADGATSSALGVRRVIRRVHEACRALPRTRSRYRST